jgi:hypothetical protein
MPGENKGVYCHRYSSYKRDTKRNLIQLTMLLMDKSDLILRD